MLLVSLLTSSLTPGIRIQRVEADSNLLFPTNSQRLTKFMMDATYGAVRPFSPAWAQRSVLDATSNSDFFGRLAYYEEMRAAGQPRGAIFAAEREGDGALCGFADVGVSLWLPNDRAFRLPQDRDLRRLAATGVGADGQRKPGVELRPYLSNLVVDASMRRWAGQALALTPAPALTSPQPQPEPHPSPSPTLTPAPALPPPQPQSYTHPSPSPTLSSSMRRGPWSASRAPRVRLG